MKHLFTVASLLLVSAVAQAAGVEWKLDASHTKVGFSVPHMMVSTVEGQFKKATATVLLDEADLTKSQITVAIPVESIDTSDAKRDEHLRSPEFFDAKKFPTITFKSTKVAKAGKAYKITGDLTIRGVTKPVTLDATLSGPVKTPWGNSMRASTITGTVKRSDFGLTWNKTLDAGGVVIGEDVKLDIQAEVTK